jgi:RNA polymerase sigma factor (sigma-70 family)
MFVATHVLPANDPDCRRQHPHSPGRPGRPRVMDPRKVYVDNLDAMNAIAESLCRRNGVHGADAEDFASDVRLKLLQNDHVVLRKYRGDSSPTTFLNVVISNLFRDRRIRLWGKWRPSAEARRIGPTAVLLETAVYRDGQSFDQACDTLSRNGVSVDPSELRRIRDALPLRTPRRVEHSDIVEDLPALDTADDAVLDRERHERLAAVSAALHRALARLEPEDRLIIKMRYLEGFSIADVARGLGLEQKPLYPRIKRVLGRLSAELRAEGIAADCLDWLDPEPT